VGKITSGRTVAFDFHGSLTLASSMWALANTLDDADGERGRAAAVALQHWRGSFATTFQNDRVTEQRNAAGIAESLRSDARSIAGMWARAMLEESKVRYAAHVVQVQAHRNLLERLAVDVIGDHANYGPAPKAPSVPQPPTFAATAQLPNY
jgi:hypothetical protein